MLNGLFAEECQAPKFFAVQRIHINFADRILAAKGAFGEISSF